MAAPNIVNVATITARTAVQAVSTTPTDIVTNAAASNTVAKINMLSISNISASAATITASVFRSTVQYRLAFTITVPVGATLIVLDKTTSIYLEEGDTLRLTASANTALEAVCSYEILA